MKKILSSILTLLILVTLLIFSANGFAQQVPLANVPFDVTNIPEPVPPPAVVQDFFQLDPYYQQWINVRGFPVLASAEVSPYALKEVAWLIYQMIGHRPDVLKVMAERTVRFVIVPHNKHTSDMPESNTGRLSFFWDVRHRAVHCKGCPITSKAEESLIGKSASPIHNFGHLFQDWGFSGIDPTFNNRVKGLYNMAISEGLYQNRYAGTNTVEYWAEGVASWFDDADPNWNVAPTRSALKKYDPRLAELMTEVFGDRDWRYTPPATRTHLPHLQGFDPEEAPIYQRPARLLELERQLEDPDSDGDGKWANLKLHDPSELPRLLNSAARENRHRTETDLIFVNLTGTEISLYFFDADGRRNFRQRIDSRNNWHFSTWVGAVWLIQDHTGKDIAVFRAEEQVGRVLIGGPPSQDTLDVNRDGIVDLSDLTPIASRYGHRGANPADINKDRIVNIVDILLVAGSVSSLPRQAVKTFKAAEVQKWLTDARQLSIEDEYQEKGIGVLKHLLTEIELPSYATEVATGPLRTIFEGHTKVVWSVAFSPDGQTLASASWDKTIRLWNLRTQQLETTLIGHTENIMSVTFSPDGQTLASAGWDKTILLWNVRTGELIGRIKAHSDGIESVLFSPDGETLASASADRTIRLWNVRTRQLERTLTGRTRIRSIAFSPNGLTLASGSREGAIQLWDPRTGLLQSTLTEQAGWVNAVAFSPDGTILVSGSGGGDNTIRLWDAKTGRHIRSITEHGDTVTSVAFSPDSQTLASGSWDRTIRLWDPRTGQEKKTLTRDVSLTAMVFSLDGMRLVSGSNDNKVRLWEITPFLSQQPIDDSDKIAISEIMVASKGGSLPQWIELYNRSDTHAVNLKGWTLEIQNRRSTNFKGRINATLTFKDGTVEPQETLLIISKQDRASNHFQNEQIYNLSNQHPNLQDMVLSEEGFYLKLSNAAGETRDEVGNIDGKRNTDDKPAWSLPKSLTEEDTRASMIRIHDHGVPRLGTDASGWISAVNTNLATSTTTYYGHPDDIGAPGIESGGALPVSLSRFRAELTDAGVSIKWIPESELDNAGFNILRSETKDGEFKIVNPKLIQGAGTTSERQTYTWTDTTAKPNVVYYYQIEDISHAGDRKQLATVRMRGYVSAAGKLTTKWGDLKLQE